MSKCSTLAVLEEKWILYCMLCDHLIIDLFHSQLLNSFILSFSLLRRLCGFTMNRATNALAVCKQIQLVFESHAHHTSWSFLSRELKRNFVSWTRKRSVCDTIFWSLISVFTVTTCCSMELYIYYFHMKTQHTWFGHRWFFL